MVKGSDILGRVENSIEIKAPPEKVWEMLAWDKASEWIAGYERVDYTSEVRTPEDRYRVGASAKVISETAGKKMEFDYEITESIENEKMTTHFTSENVSGFGTFSLKPTQAGTEITYVMEYRLPYSILGKILDKLVLGRRIEKETDLERAFENLKSILEK